MTSSSGMYRILNDGTPPVGISYTRPAWQQVFLGGPVIGWAVRRVDSKVYSLDIGGYPYTGVVDGNLIATIQQEQEQDQDWLIQYQEAQDAYTITSSSDPSLCWTVESSDSAESIVTVKPLISTKSIPPQYLPSQLWRLESMVE
ncbi:I66 family serine proteinase inhibitor [Nocardia sp. SYP-A9097]|uniref:I66 family serine proteinase inhibitor n=1 Tax=Nocardia sp. SYP-A9097 TaxID=2663237 RepID=UPI001890EDED|nr:I66 family serine proteinase inhibitor [Nocardia sp. SYP-A9097]